jgi:hypothetical protein
MDKQQFETDAAKVEAGGSAFVAWIKAHQKFSLCAGCFALGALLALWFFTK